MQIVILGQNQEALDQIYAETNQSGQMEPELYVLFYLHSNLSYLSPISSLINNKRKSDFVNAWRVEHIIKSLEGTTKEEVFKRLSIFL